LTRDEGEGAGHVDFEIRLAEESDFDAVFGVDYNHREALVKTAVERGECYAAWDGDTAAAFAIMSRNFFGFDFIELLIVSEPYRRKGIGMALLEHLYGVCGTPKLFTSTNQSNLPMQGLLDKAGFMYCGMIDALDEGDPELFYVRRKQYAR